MRHCFSLSACSFALATPTHPQTTTDSLQQCFCRLLVCLWSVGATRISSLIACSHCWDGYQVCVCVCALGVCVCWRVRVHVCVLAHAQYCALVLGVVEAGKGILSAVYGFLSTSGRAKPLQTEHDLITAALECTHSTHSNRPPPAQRHPACAACQCCLFAVVALQASSTLFGSFWRIENRWPGGRRRAVHFV